MSPQSRTKSGNRKVWKDVMIFEERLRQNMLRLNRSRRRWEVLLILLVCGVAYFGYQMFFKQDQPTTLDSTGLSITIVLLFIFFASGIFQKRLSNPSKFTTQINSMLRPFNMEFNKDHRGEISFSRAVPPEFSEGYAVHREKVMEKKGTLQT